MLLIAKLPLEVLSKFTFTPDTEWSACFTEHELNLEIFIFIKSSTTERGKKGSIAF